MKLRITVHGVAYEVDVEVLEAAEGFPGAGPLPLPLPLPLPVPQAAAAAPAPAAAPAGSTGPAGSRSIASPVAGTVLEVKVKAGDVLQENQVVIVLETMKMKTSIAAPARGKVAEVLVGVGDAVKEGQALLAYQ
ncbi:MAG TPA: biotin/lipoyl-containing protein [Thermoanaerobaculia bacterium]|nr:biotin/lipoyl-containing protein [Thermoanaerobaculia bacterium]